MTQSKIVKTRLNLVPGLLEQNRQLRNTALVMTFTYDISVFGEAVDSNIPKLSMYNGFFFLCHTRSCIRYGLKKMIRW